MNMLEDHLQNTFSNIQHDNSEFSQRGKFRQDAFQKLSQQGMPSNRDDHWKYSGLHTEVLKNFQSPVINTHENIIKQFENLPLFSKDRSQMVLLYNGQLIHKTKQSAFQFRMLNELQGQIPVNLQPFFETSWLESYSSMSLFNQSFAKDGLYLHIPDHTELTAPIYVFHLSESDKMPCMTHPQNYIFVGKHSKVQLVEIYISQGSAKILQNALTHIQIAANASLEHIIYQQSEAEQIQVATLHIQQETQSQLALHLHNISDFVSRTEVNCGLIGQGACCQIFGLEHTKGQQVQDIHLNVEHVAPQCESNIHIKSVADDSARAALTGRIKVHPNANGTSANLQAQGLLLSTGAEIDSRPQLEIYHDDVKCAHGSAIGSLDEQALFYLQSRGITAENARWMLTHGFMRQMVDVLPNEEVKSLIEASIEATA